MGIGNVEFLKLARENEFFIFRFVFHIFRTILVDSYLRYM